MARHSLILRVLPVLLGCVVSTSAFASPTYPQAIRSDLDLTEAPDCTLCHRDDLGGTDTVIRPFGRTLIEHFQLTGNNNINLLKAALAGDDAQNLDSDGDGITDLDELRMGTNPNLGASGVETAHEIPLPETGCALAPGTPASGAPLSTLMLAALGFSVRRRRHAR